MEERPMMSSSNACNMNNVTMRGRGSGRWRDRRSHRRRPQENGVFCAPWQAGVWVWGMGAGWSEAAGRGGAGRGGGRGLACVSERSSDPYLGGRGLSCLRLGSRKGNHEYGDVIARSQPVVGQTPPPLLQNPPWPHEQVLGRQGVPVGAETAETQVQK